MTPISFVGAQPFKLRAQPARYGLLGLHEPGGEHILQDAPAGPLVFTHELGHDPNSEHGFDYSAWKRFRLIARLNNGYHPNGTIPLPLYYKQFAQRVGHHVRLSRGGCKTWIIGNEINHAQEWPFENPIRPAHYAQCFELCRAEIKRQTGHENDLVIAAPIAPYYPPVFGLGFVDFFRQVVTLCETDAICLHAYSRGAQPASIASESKMGPPYEAYHSGFRVYRDFLNAVPRDKRSLPVLITETNQYDPWTNENTGWAQAAVREIRAWNADEQNQQVIALVLYRWPRYDQWAIEGKTRLYDDIRTAARL